MVKESLWKREHEELAIMLYETHKVVMFAVYYALFLDTYLNE